MTRLETEIERLRRAMSRALLIARDGQAGSEHADLVRIWKILENQIGGVAPEPEEKR